MIRVPEVGLNGVGNQVLIVQTHIKSNIPAYTPKNEVKPNVNMDTSLRAEKKKKSVGFHLIPLQ